MTDTKDIKALRDRLRALAKTATPGRWWIDSHGEALVAFTDEGIEAVLKPEHLREKAHRDENTGNLSYWPNDSDASWIAASQPQNIIALLDQLEAERQQRSAAEARVKELEGEQVPVDIWEIVNPGEGTYFSVHDPKPEDVVCATYGKLPFTAPQNPVVWLGDIAIHDDLHEVGALVSYDDVVALIETAGGIVKDGE